ncbi:protein of unknown function [Maridesulfovibrio hydrothermalis AM13 = DSM 14728]|uniref:Uncharacterized protein n=1 Tax=Maridesulfovibrio hydrothermalis AM13 = DSM 14728 TaxID=1121451 RepID=L0R9N6_9BACT|nr:protein of unknown function [Maridesulfovibrio hydrothermalis AM13 = DSM 14728]
MRASTTPCEVRRESVKDNLSSSIYDRKAIITEKAALTISSQSSLFNSLKAHLLDTK